MILKTGKIEKDIEVCALHSQRKICFGETRIDKIFTWVDASYVVHHNMKSQDGGVISMVLGVTPCRLIKGSLNIKNSTAAGLVSASNCVPYII